MEASFFNQIARFRENVEFELFRDDAPVASKFVWCLRRFTEKIEMFNLPSMFLPVFTDDWDEQFTEDEMAIVEESLQLFKKEENYLVFVSKDVHKIITKVLERSNGGIHPIGAINAIPTDLPLSQPRYEEDAMMLLPDGYPIIPQYHCQYISKSSFPLPPASRYIFKAVEAMNFWDVVRVFTGPGKLVLNKPIVLEHGFTNFFLEESVFRVACAAGLKIVGARGDIESQPKKIELLEIEAKDLDLYLEKRMKDRTVVIDASEAGSFYSDNNWRLHRLYCSKHRDAQRKIPTTHLRTGMYGKLNVPKGSLPVGTEVCIVEVKVVSEKIGTYVFVPLGSKQRYDIPTYTNNLLSISPLRYHWLKSISGMICLTERRFDHVILINPNRETASTTLAKLLCLSSYLELVPKPLQPTASAPAVVSPRGVALP